MKIRTELEITPEEALQLVQQPQYSWMKEVIDWNLKHNPMAIQWPYVNKTDEKEKEK